MKKLGVNKRGLTRAIVLGTLLTGGCSSQPVVTAPPAIPVKLQTLESGILVDTSEYVGSLEARERVSLAPQINGRIAKIFVKSGDIVTVGQPIVELEPTQQQEQVNAAAAEVDVARANLTATQSQLKQQQVDVEGRQAQIAQSRANVANAEANLKNQQANFSSREAILQRSIANLDLAQKTFERSQFLVKQGAQPQQDLDTQSRNLRASRADVNSARQDRDAARASVEAARATVQANKEALNLAIKNVASAQQQVATAQANVNSQQAAVSRAQGQLGSTRQNLVFNTVTAPINGMIGDFNDRKVGDIVNVGQQLTTLIDNKMLDLNVSIPTELQSRLRVGLPVEIVKADGTPGVRGQVTYIAPSVTQNTQSILTKFSFTNDGSLRDRQYSKVRVIWDKKPGVLIPTTAITSVGAQKFVFVARSPDNKEGATPTPSGNNLVVRQIPIQVGTIQGQTYQVISGVKAGDQIAVSRILDLRDGTPISVSEQ
ncbi:MAG: efflux RND transporter periplasmic adaptor subunit [Chlorogloea purpurea SAG 13.99]|nr:efflux RND transporter periplasmic adaptor subunit [Chlorogloea purpurea SAG 13.99]